jgi:hypothetical protein
MEKKKFLHELGLTAKDKITGFSGIITVRCEFLTGCNRYCIQPVELKDGKPLDTIYFDEAQISIIGEGINAKDVTGEENGACSPDPIK